MHVVVILENISMVFSMYRFGSHIGHLFPEEVFRIYVHGCHIDHVFPEKILRVYRMYGRDCHIVHVFPEKYFQGFYYVWVWFSYWLCVSRKNFQGY